MTANIEMVSVCLVFVQNLDSLLLASEFKGFVHLNGFHLIQKFDGIFLFGRRRRQLSTTVICLLQFYSCWTFFFLKKKTEIFFYKYWTIGHSVHLTTTTYTVKELQIFYFHDFLSKNYVKLIYHKTTKVQNDFTIYFVSESELVFFLHCVV